MRKVHTQHVQGPSGADEAGMRERTGLDAAAVEDDVGEDDGDDDGGGGDDDDEEEVEEEADEDELTSASFIFDDEGADIEDG